MSAAHFHSEDLGIPMELAENLAKFMAVAHHCNAVTDPKVWSKHGLARVYFELWSQNSLPPLEMLQRAYYDAADDDVYFVRSYPDDDITETLIQVAQKKSRGIFSGAKTRAAIKEFAEKFYG